MKTTNTPSTPVATGDNTTATARPWPGNREWNDDDYKQFVQLYSQGAFPEIRNDPTAWDYHIIPADNGGDSQRPTLISHHDFHHHLPAAHRSGHGFLVLKLWETARAKGYTKTFEQQIEEAARQQAEADKQQLRNEIQNLRGNLPTPTPKLPADPRQQWYEKILAAALPGTKLIEKVKQIQQAVIDGQPFRNSLLTEAAAQLIEETFGPFMLPESHDPLTNPIPPDAEEDDNTTAEPKDNIDEPDDSTNKPDGNDEPDDNTDEPEPILKKWTPEATATQVVTGAARDLADLVSLLIARQRIAVGFEADHKTIHEIRQLTRSLRDLTQIVKDTTPKKRGPKPKIRLPAL